MSARDGARRSKSAELSTIGDVDDCTCRICTCILIEPVLLPCKHELCLRCFNKTVDQTSLVCPFCRFRISSWARKATRLGTLVDAGRWSQVKASFPDHVRRRMEAGDDDSDGDIDPITVPQTNHSLSKPGEIRREYETEMERLMEESERCRLDEEAASRDFIEKIKKEEEDLAQVYEEQRQRQAESDELLARRLAIGFRASPRLSTDVPRFPDQCRVKVEQTAGPEITIGNTLEPTCISLAPIDSLYISEVVPSSSPSASSSSTVVGVCSTPVSSTGTHSTHSIKYVKKGTLGDNSKTESRIKPCPTVSRCKSESCSQSSQEVRGVPRPASADSISPELNHFKPIHTSPKTPPRRQPDGKMVAPPVVVCTPRNLMAQFTEPHQTTDDAMHSHDHRVRLVTMKRIQALGQDRTELITAPSKATNTTAPGLIDDQANSSTLHTSTSPGINGVLSTRDRKNTGNDTLPAGETGEMSGNKVHTTNPFIRSNGTEKRVHTFNDFDDDDDEYCPRVSLTDKATDRRNSLLKKSSVKNTNGQEECGNPSSALSRGSGKAVAEVYTRKMRARTPFESRSAQQFNKKRKLLLEQRDERLAQRLQKQFELEARYNLNSVRMKGSGEEYPLRKRKKSVDARRTLKQHSA